MISSKTSLPMDDIGTPKAPFRSLSLLAIIFASMVSATAALGQTPPLPPASVTAQVSILAPSSRVGVRISWSDSSNDEDGFQVLYFIGGNSAWSSLAYMPAGSTETFIDQDAGLLPVGTNLSFAVRSLKGTYVNVGSFTITAASGPDAPPNGPYATVAWPNAATAAVFNPPGLSTATIPTSTDTTNVLRLVWVDNSNCEDSVEVEARDTASVSNTFQTLGGVTFGATQFDFSNYLVAGHSYELRIRARRATTFSSNTYGGYQYTGYSNVLNVTAPGPITGAPAQPTNLTVAAFLNGTAYTYSVDWDDRSTNETHFQIEEKTTGALDSTYVNLGLLGGSAGLNDGLGVQIANNYVAGSQKTFRITAWKSVGPFAEKSAPSVAFGATQGTFTAPTDLRLSNTLDNGRISLFWSDNATTETGYDFEYRFGSTGGFSSRGSIGLTAFSRYQFDGGMDWIPASGSDPSIGFPPSTQVDMRIRAYQGSLATTTAYSNVVSLTTQPLTAPTGVQVSAITKNGATVTWTDNSNNETNYQIMYRPAGTGSFSILKSGIARNAVTTNVTGLTPGTAYDIQVRASFDFNDGTFIAGTSSSTATFTTKDGFISNTNPPITFGTAFTYQTQTSSVSPRTAWNITGLPANLSFNSTNGQITGTPSVAGLFTATMTASFQDGTNDSVSLVLRIIRPAGPPEVAAVISDFTIPLNGNNSSTSLTGKFADPDAESAVQIQTTLGNINVILYNSATPQTVANFMAYANAGRYTDVAFHRAASLGGGGATAANRDILQGGGYVTSTAPDSFLNVTKFPALVNEAGISNVTNTIAMAKIGGLPDSATSEFFFNVKNNASALDNNNGGFSVFGRVAGATTSVVSSITNLPTYGETTPVNELPTIRSYSININGQSTGPAFPDWPMNTVTAPSSMNNANVVKINAVNSIPVLSYSVTGNSNSAVVAATVTGNNLVLTPLSIGQSTLTVQATDLDGNNVTQSFTLTVAAPSTNNDLSALAISASALDPVFATGTLAYTASVPNATSSLTVTPTVADSTATVKVNGSTVVSGAASAPINLSVGVNNISVVVTAQDNSTKTYTIAVTRQPTLSEISVEQPTNTVLTDGVSSISYGNVIVGTPATLTFTIRNLGSADLAGIAVTKDGANAADFIVTGPSATSLAPGGAGLTFTVALTPAVSGPKTAAIHIANNDSDENPFDISLTGTALSPKAEMVTPVAGTTFTSTSATFNWVAGASSTSYALWIGSADGAYDIYAGNEGTNLSKTVTTLPTDGRTLYVTLHSLVGGLYVNNKYTYKAVTGVKAQVTSPVNGSTLASTSLVLAWNQGVACTSYYLFVGTTPGGYDLYAGDQGTTLTKTVTVPTGGAKVYATLYSLISGVYRANTYVYTTVPSVKCALATPANGATLTDENLALTWSAGTGVTKCVIWVGSAYGGYDLAAVDAGTTTSRTITVPRDGGPVYVTLWSLINGAYQGNNYWFTTALPVSGNRPARLTSHANTSTLPSNAITLAWDAGSGASQYALWVGNNPDGYDIYAGNEGAGLSRAVTLPGDGRRVYVTLHSLIGGAYQSNSYYFTCPALLNGGAAQLTSHVSGATLTSNSLDLTWNAGAAGTTGYALWVGSAPAGYDLYAANEGTALARTVTVPVDGRPIYVTLYSLINGAYQSNSYFFTTANTATGSKRSLITSHVNGSTLSSGSATFVWDGGTNVTSRALWIGSSPGAYDLQNPFTTTAGLSYPATSLPTDGRKIYVTLHSLIGGAYQSSTYQYTAANIAVTKAVMVGPVPGTTLANATPTFNWNPSNAATAYALWVGRTPGTYDIYAGAEGLATSKAVTVPVDGTPVYVTLYSFISGAWQSNEYIYTAPIIIAP